MIFGMRFASAFNASPPAARVAIGPRDRSAADDASHRGVQRLVADVEHLRHDRQALAALDHSHRLELEVPVVSPPLSIRIDLRSFLAHLTPPSGFFWKFLLVGIQSGLPFLLGRRTFVDGLTEEIDGFLWQIKLVHRRPTERLLRRLQLFVAEGVSMR